LSNCFWRNIKRFDPGRKHEKENLTTRFARDTEKEESREKSLLAQDVLRFQEMADKSQLFSTIFEILPLRMLPHSGPPFLTEDLERAAKRECTEGLAQNTHGSRRARRIRGSE
jgi:hypothetical protein